MGAIVHLIRWRNQIPMWGNQSEELGELAERYRKALESILAELEAIAPDDGLYQVIGRFEKAYDIVQEALK